MYNDPEDLCKQFFHATPGITHKDGTSPTNIRNEVDDVCARPLTEPAAMYDGPTDFPQVAGGRNQGPWVADLPIGHEDTLPGMTRLGNAQNCARFFEGWGACIDQLDSLAKELEGTSL